MGQLENRDYQDFMDLRIECEGHEYADRRVGPDWVDRMCVSDSHENGGSDLRYPCWRAEVRIFLDSLHCPVTLNYVEDGDNVVVKCVCRRHDPAVSHTGIIEGGGGTGIGHNREIQWFTNAVAGA